MPIKLRALSRHIQDLPHLPVICILSRKRWGTVKTRRFDGLCTCLLKHESKLRVSGRTLCARDAASVPTTIRTRNACRGRDLEVIHVLLLFFLKTSTSTLMNTLAHTSGRQKFMLVNHVQKNAVWSAADRITKSNLRGRCGTINYHTGLNLYQYKAVRCEK